ncbi:MAG TPA: M13 family metallopeptidase [Kofleriaceae bacterium]
MKRALALCLLVACSKHDQPPPPKPAPAPTPTEVGSGSAMATAPTPKANPNPIDTAGMDTSVKPGDDFFKYANGSWLAKTEIPADKGAWGAGGEIAELTDKRNAELIKDAAKNAPPGSDARRVGDYYSTFMDEATIESKGLTPLQPQLDAIAAIKDAKGLATALGQSIRSDVDVLNATNLYTANVFGLWIAQDLDDPSRYVPFVLQGGLGMPDRDYYLDPSPKMAEIRTKYLAHVTKMLDLLKVADSAAKAKRIVALETAIAKAHGARVDSEDVHKGDNHWKRADLTAKAPGLDWPTFLEAAGLGAVNDFVIWQPKGIIGISAQVAATPLDVWKDYLTLHAVEHAASFLPKAFVDETFAFYAGVLAGVPQISERWKRGVRVTNAALDMAVGKLYVDKYFPPAEKARAEAMVKNLIAAMGARIDHLDWMAPATKEKAKAKLAVLKVGVGYPDQWRDYSSLQIVAGDALGNAQRAEQFDLQRNLAKLGKPVDRSEWVMPPQLVNAVNCPAMNALNFPAAILQGVFFDPTRPESMDYGATGAVIGHEISHSFDDQGAMFDATGKMANWWTPDDLKHFQAAGARLAAQFDKYKPFPDIHVNGKQTLSENIADIAGLYDAYDAYRASLAGKEPPTVQGFTGDQQFFISFAQAWRGKMREPLLRQVVITDGHAPSEYRADTVRNMDAWYGAFSVKDGALFLAPADRAKIW